MHVEQRIARSAVPLAGYLFPSDWPLLTNVKARSREAWKKSIASIDRAEPSGSRSG
jgi:hypothetical protein